jgi:hypothetical protein
LLTESAGFFMPFLLTDSWLRRNAEAAPEGAVTPTRA